MDSCSDSILPRDIVAQFIFTMCCDIGPAIVAVPVPARGLGRAVVPAAAHGNAVLKIVVPRTVVLESVPGKENDYYSP